MNNEVYLYIKMEETDCEKVLGQLFPFDTDGLVSFPQQPQHKLRTALRLCAYVAVKYIVSQRLNVSIWDIAIEKEKNGRPYIRNYPQEFFSISHTKDAITLAFSNQPIGVDIEVVSEMAPKILKRFFAKHEQEYIKWGTTGDRTRFYEVWTRKEAYLKQQGKGLSYPLQSFSVLDPLIKARSLSIQLGKYVVSFFGGNIVNHGALSIDEVTPEQLIPLAIERFAYHAESGQ